MTRENKPCSIFGRAGAVLVLLVWLLPGGPARGQDEALHAIWQRVLGNNPQLQSARAQAEIAGMQLAFQQRERFPKLTSGASYAYVSEIPELQIPIPFPGVAPFSLKAGTYNRYDFTATVQQPIFTGWRLRNQARAAQSGMLARRAEYRARRNGLLLQAGTLYYQILLRQLQEEVVDQAVARADLHLQRARSLFRAAQATAFDTLEVANRKLRLLNRKRQLENARRILEARLRRLIGGKDLPEMPTAVEDQKIDQTLPPLDSLLQRAQVFRPELQALQAKIEMDNAKSRVARSLYFPQIYGSATYHYARPGVNFFRDEWMSYYTVGIGLKWDLWNWGQRHLQVQQAELSRRASELQQMDMKNQVEEQVKEAYYRLLTLRDQIDLQQRLVEQERERYRLTRIRYKQSQATSLDLSDAEKSLYSAELTQKQYWVQWQTAWLQLQFATGTIGRSSGLMDESHEQR